MKIILPASPVFTSQIGSIGIEEIPGEKVHVEIAAFDRTILDAEYLAHNGKAEIYGIGALLAETAAMSREDKSICFVMAESGSVRMFNILYAVVSDAPVRLMTCSEYLMGRFLTTAQSLRVPPEAAYRAYHTVTSSESDPLRLRCQVSVAGKHKIFTEVNTNTPASGSSELKTIGTNIDIPALREKWAKEEGVLVEDVLPSHITAECGSRSLTLTVDYEWEGARKYVFRNNFGLMEVAWLPTSSELGTKKDVTFSRLEEETRACDTSLQAEGTDTSCELSPSEQDYYSRMLASGDIGIAESVAGKPRKIMVTGISSSVKDSENGSLKFKWRYASDIAPIEPSEDQGIFSQEFSNSFI